MKRPPNTVAVFLCYMQVINGREPMEISPVMVKVKMCNTNLHPRPILLQDHFIKNPDTKLTAKRRKELEEKAQEQKMNRRKLGDSPSTN